jgi:deazaflavin-dependent oxidoreductase (nitroreductase family)
LIEGVEEARVAFPKDAVAKAITTFHRLVFDVSKGKLAGKASGMPVIKLTTIGRKSGQRRTTMLTSPLVKGDNVVLVASYGGDDRDPAWFRNLAVNPDVEIVMNGSTRAMRARVTEDVERTRLWEELTADHANYAGYQRKTSRQIPVVMLEPKR